MKNLAILTSGGDAPGMNGAIRSLVRSGHYYGFSMYGIHGGYQGLLNEEIHPISCREVGGIVHRGGTILGTARCPDFKEEAVQERALSILRNREIDGLIVIGGDGSMAGAQALSRLGMPTMTLPGTIDNDMNGTDQTLGFDTALNTIVEAVNKIRDTIASHARVAVVEVMGRHAGHLALHAGLACGAEVVLIPEGTMPLDEMAHRLYESHKRGKTYSIVLVAEGAYSGVEVRDYLKQYTYFDPALTVLGYIQRGGSPSAVDNLLAARLGEAAIRALRDGQYNALVGMRQGQLVVTPYAEVNQYPNPIPKDLRDLLGVLGT